MKTISTAILSLFFTFSVFSQTTIPGGTITDLDWTKAESPYQITGDITLDWTDELVIEPGVDIIFMDDYIFNVQGRLLATGNTTDSIWFYPADTLVGWQGIRFLNQNTNGQDSSKLEYCKIMYGNADGPGEDAKGGGIYCNNSSELLINNSELSHNLAETGGGLYCDATSHPMIVASVFEYNHANFGGGIYGDYSNFQLSSSLVRFNQAVVNGGGIYCNSGSPAFTSDTILNNQADEGGGIYAYSSNITIYNSSVNYNIALINGGGVFQLSSNCNFFDTDISFNSSLNEEPGSGGYPGGGGIYIRNGSLNQTRVTFEGNSTNEAGGGIHCQHATIIADSVEFVSNSAVGVGGGIYSHDFDDISFLNTQFNYNQSNMGGGIYTSQSSESYFENVTFLGNKAIDFGGGASFAHSTCTLLNVEFRHDTANIGGGIAMYECSNVQFEKVLISNNHATDKGGGILFRDSGGSTVDFVNVTFSNNTAVNDGKAIFTTVNDNLTIENSIIWGHSPPAISGSGIITATYSDIEGGYTGTGNINQDPLFVDPGNGDFHLNWTNPPYSWGGKSPCIDAGNPGSPPDPDGTIADMGAYYYHHTFTSISGNINDTLKCSESPYYAIGDLTVQTGEELVIEPCVHLIFMDDYRLNVLGRLLAIGNTTDSIWFHPDDTIVGWQGIRFINQNTNGQDSSKLEYCKIMYGKADGPGEDAKGGGIYCTNSSGLIIKNSELSHNQAEKGGGIYCDSLSNPLISENVLENNQALSGGGIYGDSSSFQLVDCDIRYNTATDKGGGIYVRASSVPIITDNNIYNNTAFVGGGIYADSSNCQVFYCFFQYNQATEKGGGIYCNRSSIPVFKNDTISYNQANKGGGLYTYTSNLQITNNYIAGNQATNGGGMYSDSCEYQMTGGGFSGNVAEANGGGIYQRLGIGNISGVQFINNSGNLSNPAAAGGGIYCEDVNLTLSDLNFTNNYAFDAGGGIYSSGSILNLDSVDFSGCGIEQGGGGGGMFISGSSDCDLTDVTITNCYGTSGGGIVCSGSSLFLLNVILDANSSDYNGGGLKCSSSNITMLNVEITDNDADRGGGLYCSSSTLSMLNVGINNNSSANYGGGIYLASSELTSEYSWICDNSSYGAVGGGGIFMDGNSSMEVINTTFSNNLSVSGGALYAESGSSASLLNSIVWQNSDNQIDGLGSIDVTYSDIEGGWPGTGNIDTDPIFMDPLNGDYHLSWANFPTNDTTRSPCIDTGDPLSPKDPDSSRADMGACFYDQYYELDIKTFLEGPFFFSQMIPFLNIAQYIPLSQPYGILPWNYDGTESVPEIPNDDIIDWLLIELRDANSAENATGLTSFERQAVFLKKDGRVVGLDGINFPRIHPVLTNDLYIVIMHRNHLGILSSTPPGLNGRVFSYDFTNGEDKVFGEDKAHKQIYPGIWGLMAADGNADGQIDNSDKNDIWYLQRSLSGYLQGDFDMDTDVDIIDKDNLWKSNSGKSSFVPE